MKVRELIAQLVECDADAEVSVDTDFQELDEDDGLELKGARREQIGSKEFVELLLVKT